LTAIFQVNELPTWFFAAFILQAGYPALNIQNHKGVFIQEEYGQEEYMKKTEGYQLT